MRVELRHAEVEHLRLPLRRQHDVQRLDVTVHETLRVSRGQRVADLRGDSCDARGLEWQRTGLLERRAFHVLHHEEADGSAARRIGTGRHADVVQRADVRVVERRDCSSLALESFLGLLVGRDVGRQHLDRHCTIEARVARLVDLAHATRSDPVGEQVGPEVEAFKAGRDCGLERPCLGRGQEARGTLVRREQGFDVRFQLNVVATR